MRKRKTKIFLLKSNFKFGCFHHCNVKGVKAIEIETNRHKSLLYGNREKFIQMNKDKIFDF